MNAVIVDIRKKQAAALDETGRVVRIPNANYEIGQTIELHEVKPVRTSTMLKRLSTGAAAAVLAALILSPSDLHVRILFAELFLENLADFFARFFLLLHILNGF